MNTVKVNRMLEPNSHCETHYFAQLIYINKTFQEKNSVSVEEVSWLAWLANMKLEYVLVTDVVEVISPFFLTLRLNFRKGKEAPMEKKGKKSEV